MKSWIIAGLFLLSACASKPIDNGVPLAADGFYGEKFPVIETPDLDAVKPPLNRLPSSEDNEIVVKARVSDVCLKKGCWMKVTGRTGEALRVTFKEYDFFVPTALVGRDVALKGRFIAYNETVAEQKHLLEDARRPQAEIDSVTSPRLVLRFEASGVKDLTKSY